LRKLPDWVQRFEQVVLDAENKEFDWVEHNCFTFASSCFEAITGRSWLVNQPKITSKRKALSIMAKYSKDGVEGSMEKLAGRFGMAEVPPGLAKRGDPVLLECQGEDLFATIDLTGRGVLAIRDDGQGLIRMNISEIKRAWSIT
jgi:hypothetical protein